MVALLIMLTNIDNIPLPHWWLPIQPNSLIAVLTTVAKSSMLVSVASCISQLKWNHFSRYSRKLVDLETFDEASRGPWGSATLIWSLNFRVPVIITSGLALVTIMPLGIDPCAQQVLKFPMQPTPLDNVTVQMGIANQYYSKGMLQSTKTGKLEFSILHGCIMRIMTCATGGYIFVPNADLLHLQASIINNVAETIFQLHVECPTTATRCYWHDFTTLGICSDYRNVTDTVQSNCTGEASSGYFNCTYTFPDLGKPPK